MGMQEEIKKAAYEGASEAQKEVVFPSIQKVEVINQETEKIDFSTIENTLKSILEALANKKGVDISILENRLQLILAALEKETEEKDYSDILASIKEAIPESFDMDEYFDRLDERLEKFKISEAIKEGLKGFTSSNWLPVVDTLVVRPTDYNTEVALGLRQGRFSGTLIKDVDA